MSQSDTPEVDARALLAADPAVVIRRYPERAQAIADRARAQGKPDVAADIEARIQRALEGSS